MYVHEAVQILSDCMEIFVISMMDIIPIQHCWGSIFQKMMQ
jgi:hypothetical protein